MSHSHGHRESYANKSDERFLAAVSRLEDCNRTCAIRRCLSRCSYTSTTGESAAQPGDDKSRLRASTMLQLHIVRVQSFDPCWYICHTPTPFHIFPICSHRAIVAMLVCAYCMLFLLPPHETKNSTRTLQKQNTTSSQRDACSCSSNSLNLDLWHRRVGAAEIC